MGKKGWVVPFLFILLWIVSAENVCYPQKVSSDSLTVAGFVNLDGHEQDYVNIMVTTYLTTFLSKIFKNVPVFSEVEKYAVNSGFWATNRFDAMQAIALADDLKTRFCITGHYLVQKNREMIFTLYIYDIKSKSLQLERTYLSSTDKDMFGSVDKMIRDILFLLIGNSVEIGRLKVSVLEGAGKYQVSLNGNAGTGISRGFPFESVFMAGQTVEVALKKENDGKEVFRKKVLVEKDRITEVAYRPTGSILVISHRTNAEVRLNGRIAGMTGPDGELSIPEVETLHPAELEILENGAVVFSKSAVLVEGEVNRVRMSDEKIPLDISFPLQFGMKGLWKDLFAAVGVEVHFAKQMELFFSAGGVVYYYPDSGTGVLPFLDLGAGYFWEIAQNVSLGLKAYTELFFWDRVSADLAALLELRLGNFFLTAGARYSFEPVYGGFYPTASAGYRF